MAFLFMLGDTGVRTVSFFYRFFVFIGSRIYAAARFTDVDGLSTAFTVEFVNAFAFTRRWVSLVFVA